MRFSPRDHASRAALRISAIYGLVGVAWILGSDRFITLLYHDPEAITAAQTYKGWAFVLATSALLFLLVRQFIHHRDREADRRLRAEQEQRTASEQLLQAVEAAKVGLWDWDLRTNAVQYSGEWMRQIGHTRGEIGSTFEEWRDRVHPDDLERSLRTVQDFIDRPRPGFQLEYRLRHKDGTYRWILASGAVFCDEQGKAVRMLGSHVDITDRRLAEDQLRRSEAGLALAQELAGLGNWELDPASGEGTWSAAMYSLFHCDPAHGLPDFRKFLQLVHPEDQARLLHTHEEAMGTLGPRNLTMRSHPDRGPLRHFAARIEALRDSSGRATKLTGIVLDVTDQHEAAERLRESESRYRQLFESNPHPMWVFDRETLGFLAVNDAAVRHYKYSREEFLGMTIRDIRPPSEVPRLLENLAHETDGVDEAGVWRHQKRDGETILVEIISHTLDWNGRPAEMVVAHDVTERLQAEVMIREQAALLETANDAIYMRSLDRVIRYWNRGAEQLYGWTREEVLGHRTTEFISSDPAAADSIQKELLREGSWTGERRQATRSGLPVVTFCRLTLLRDARGQPRAVLAINTDITEKKRLEEQFLRAQRLESIGALASGIAHDLNNILAPILMAAPFVRAGTTNTAHRELLETIETSARRGADIVRQVLTFARGVPGDRIPVQVRHVLREVETIMRETFPKNIVLRVERTADLWLVPGDATQVHQALLNLCVNARDAMPDGGRLVLAAANVHCDEAFASTTPDAHPGPYVCLSVADSGTGIAPENLNRIFEPFFTTKPPGEGTGLGLASVLGIVRSHGGFHRATSRPGSGSTFELYFPASPEAAGAEIAPAGPEPARGRGELVLVVDDEVAVRSLLHRVLERHGYRVVSGADGREGLALFNQHRDQLRVVISDVVMPVMDGPAFMRAVREADAQLPIIAMSGLADTTTPETLESLGLAEFLTKPFMVVRVLESLGRALSADATGMPTRTA